MAIVNRFSDRVEGSVDVLTVAPLFSLVVDDDDVAGCRSAPIHGRSQMLEALSDPRTEPLPAGCGRERDLIASHHPAQQMVEIRVS